MRRSPYFGKFTPFTRLNNLHSLYKAGLECGFSVLVSAWGHGFLLVMCSAMRLPLKDVSVVVNVYCGLLKEDDCEKISFTSETKYFNHWQFNTKNYCVLTMRIFLFLPHFTFFSSRQIKKRSMCGCWESSAPFDLAAPERLCLLYLAWPSTRPLRLTPRHVSRGGEQRARPCRCRRHLPIRRLDLRHSAGLPCNGHIQGPVQEREEERWTVKDNTLMIIPSSILN